MAMGPIDLTPGDTQTVAFALIAGVEFADISQAASQAHANYANNMIVSVDDNNEQPISAFTLSQNYPNPFNPSTRIEYTLPRRSTVVITIHNLLGQTVCQLYDGVQSAGKHFIEWNGTDDKGNEVASGVYFYRMKTDQRLESKKMLLLK